MQNPLNPLENQDPMEPHHNPFEDPLLDALEKSIEQPPGFIDPLAEDDGLLMDDLAGQLDVVEAGIENSPPIPPEPNGDSGVSDVQDDETSHVSPPLDDNVHDQEQDDSDDVLDTMPPPLRSPYTGSFGQGGPGSILPRPSQNINQGQRSHPTRIYKSYRGGRTGAATSRGLRYCPESHDTVDRQQCEDCDKYRNWPEGTSEEPRECWYDWQAESSTNGPDSDSNDRP